MSYIGLDVVLFVLLWFAACCCCPGARYRMIRHAITVYRTHRMIIGTANVAPNMKTVYNCPATLSGSQRSPHDEYWLPLCMKVPVSETNNWDPPIMRPINQTMYTIQLRCNLNHDVDSFNGYNMAIYLFEIRIKVMEHLLFCFVYKRKFITCRSMAIATNV